MPTRIFIDTLFVYENHQFLVSDAVLLEIGNGLARNYKQEAIEVIEGFFDSEEVEVVRLTPELFERAFGLYKRYGDKDWGLIDCVSFLAMTEAGVTQDLTFDQYFEQAGFSVLMADADI